MTKLTPTLADLPVHYVAQTDLSPPLSTARRRTIAYTPPPPPPPSPPSPPPFSPPMPPGDPPVVVTDNTRTSRSIELIMGPLGAALAVAVGFSILFCV